MNAPQVMSPDLAPRLDIPVRRRIEEVRDTFPFQDRQRAVFDRGISALRPELIEALFEKYGHELAEANPKGVFKYLDMGFWLWSKVLWVVLLDLDRAKPLNILDLGCGPSHFGFLCKTLGHKVVGLDVDVPIYIDMCRALEIDRRTFRIERDDFLPFLDRHFDLVVAFDVCFNYIGAHCYYWSVADWIGMFRAIIPILSPDGRLLLYLNTMRLPSGEYGHHERLIDSLVDAGAQLIQKRRNRLLLSRRDLESLCSLKE